MVITISDDSYKYIIEKLSEYPNIFKGYLIGMGCANDEIELIIKSDDPVRQKPYNTIILNYIIYAAIHI